MHRRPLCCCCGVVDTIDSLFRFVRKARLLRGPGMMYVLHLQEKHKKSRYLEMDVRVLNIYGRCGLISSTERLTGGDHELFSSEPP